MEISQLLNAAIEQHKQGNLTAALKNYLSVLKIQPNNLGVLLNLGAIYKALGNNSEAIAHYSKALQLKPDMGKTWYNLGNVLFISQELEAALKAYKKAIEYEPKMASAYFNIAKLLQDLGKKDEAIAYYENCIAVEPSLAIAYVNLGILLKEKGIITEAIACFDKAIELQPDLAEAYYNKGETLSEIGEHQQAIIAYQQSLQYKKDLALAYRQIGIAYIESKLFPEAIPYLQQAIQIDNTDVTSYVSLSYALTIIGRSGDAISNCEKALELEPASARVYLNYSFALLSQGKITEGLEYSRKCLEIDPNCYEAQANILYAMKYDDIYTPEEIALEHYNWGLKIQKQIGNPIVYNRQYPANKTIKVGYLSPDFRQHSVSYFIEPIIENHNREEIEVFIYSNVAKPDEITERLKKLTCNWRDITRIKDEEVLEIIHKDEIDILVDLSGHTAENRLTIFAKRAAPIQIVYIGYPNTTGLPTMDYRLTDYWADPHGMTDNYYTEKLIRLQRCFLCYKPPLNSPPVSELPANNNNIITFGSFNNLQKQGNNVIKLWAEIIKKVPNSRLILKSKGFEDEETKNRYWEKFAEFNIDKERIILIGWVKNIPNHLSYYDNIDIALDPFPYNGTTTTCEALWMGVPVITLAGKVHAARVGVSLLSSVGLSDLIANTPEEYVEIAVKLASFRDDLGNLRSSLREKVRQSPLTDGVGLTREIEAIYKDRLNLSNAT